MSAPTSEILNFNSKLQFKWTDSEDFIRSFQSQLLSNDKADNIFKTTFSKFLLKKQIPIWIKRGGVVKQYSYYDLLQEHLISGNPDNFNILDCDFSYYSENGPFVTNSMMQIIGDKKE
jgi:hypothetical protein